MRQLPRTLKSGVPPREYTQPSEPQDLWRHPQPEFRGSGGRSPQGQPCSVPETPGQQCRHSRAHQCLQADPTAPFMSHPPWPLCPRASHTPPPAPAARSWPSPTNLERNSPVTQSDGGHTAACNAGPTCSVPRTAPRTPARDPCQRPQSHPQPCGGGNSGPPAHPLPTHRARWTGPASAEAPPQPGDRTEGGTHDQCRAVRRHALRDSEATGLLP